MSRLVILLLLSLPWCAWADPDVRVQSRLVPADGALVGATVSLQVDLLVDSWFTAAPVLPQLQLPGAVITPPNGEAQHLNQTIDGKAFFGLRYTWQITPQVAGAFRIPALSYQVQPGPGNVPVTLTSKPLSFSAKALAGAGDQPHLIASNVKLSQSIQLSHDPLRVGDSITRTLSLQAEGAQAMSMPAPAFVQIAGLKRYVQPAQVKPLSDGRGGTVGGAREDSVTYVVERAGALTLPAVQMKWWDYAGNAHDASVDAVSFNAAAAEYRAPFSIDDDLRALGQQARIKVGGHWLLIVVGVLAGTLSVWLCRRWFEPARGAWRAWREKRRQRWLDSADFAWAGMARQLQEQPPRLDALYLWVRRSSGKQTLQRFFELFPDTADVRCLNLLEIRYREASGGEYVPADLMENLRRVRQRIKHDNAAHQHPALKPLNP
ncbi:hypothetical protein ACIPW4_18985 [Pseudomonas sp. NPDC089996]|uniref:hypothetical protein n=1 Tax=Pseudomonas sp. NPDC089996 TaxID=3364474 RepID=UPI0037F67375